MANILDEIDVIKNIENMYESNTAFNVLKDFERIIDELDLYVYKNWSDGELAEGPNIDRHWVTAKFMWPRETMPDPMGAKRLLDYDCKVNYQKMSLLKPRKVTKKEDLRPGTKFGKLDRHPIWVVEIAVPKKMLMDFYAASAANLEAEAQPNDQLQQQQLQAQQAQEVEASPEEQQITDIPV